MMHHIYSKQSGFSLLEILIAVLVLGIGLLGVAGLQNTTVRSMQSSFERSQAIILLDMLAERMRSDAVNARNGAYAVNCQSDTLAEWHDIVKVALNNPDACVEIEFDGALREYTLTLSWTDDRIMAGADSAISLRVSP